jgi:hypothetical protein
LFECSVSLIAEQPMGQYVRTAGARASATHEVYVLQRAEAPFNTATSPLSAKLVVSLQSARWYPV